MSIYISISNAAADHHFLQALRTHLLPVARRHSANLSSAEDIMPGGDVRSDRLRLLAGADLLLLLLSADYVQQCEAEAREAMHQQLRGAVVITLRLRPCLYHDEPYSGLSALPNDPAFLSQLTQPEQEMALVNIATALDMELRRLRTRSLPPPARPRLPPPTGAYDPAWYIHRPKLESRALDGLEHRNALVLQGPRDFGKATLLGHIIAQIVRMAPTARVVRVHLGILRQQDPQTLASESATLRCLGLLLSQALPRPGAVPEDLVAAAWARPGTTCERLGHLVEEHLLPAADPLILCIEQLERVHGLPFEHALLAMFRGWLENQRSPWPRLRIVATVATEPTLMQRTDTSGFFKAATILELPPLDLRQASDLARQYGFAPEARGLSNIFQRVNGHPLLLRRWLHEAYMDGVEPVEVAEWPVVRGHLLGLRRELEEQKLVPALVRVLAGNRIKDEEYGALYRLGLIEAESATRNRLRAPLYEDFVKELTSRKPCKPRV